MLTSPGKTPACFKTHFPCLSPPLGSLPDTEPRRQVLCPLERSGHPSLHVISLYQEQLRYETLSCPCPGPANFMLIETLSLIHLFIYLTIPIDHLQ